MEFCDVGLSNQVRGKECFLLIYVIFGSLILSSVFDNSFRTKGGEIRGERTWQEFFELILKERNDSSPDKVDKDVWDGFMLFAFVLIPCVQSW